MSHQPKLFEPSQYVATAAHGLTTAFEPGTRTLLAGHQLGPGFLPLPTDVVLEKDVAVTLRDGVTIYVDVFRPSGATYVPVLVAWSPYGKSHGSAPGTLGLLAMLGMDNSTRSGYEKFEGPDPAYWCARGYAVCNPDPRGIAHSEGDSAMFGRQEAEDCHDLVEWLAGREWSNGKVGMTGTSYLAVAQWFTAAEQPPHLAAINPVEGFSDIYRDLVMRGGMPDTGFAERLQKNSYAGQNRREDILAEAEQHPLVDELWEEKVPEFGKVTVPAYIVASYSNTLHNIGTFRGWRSIASEDKWLRIHNSQEWPDYYDPQNTDDLRRFFDRYLKDEDNGWEETPRVRYCLHDFEGGDRVGPVADEFPPRNVELTKYYLDAPSRSLTLDAPAHEAEVGYDTAVGPGLTSFTVRFDEETVLVGYPKAHLWVEARGADDMDLFVLVQKLDANGTHLQQFTVPNRGAVMQDLTEYGCSVLRYKGSNGRLRASMRHLDEVHSTDEIPVHSFDRVEKLEPGQVVALEIDLTPVGMLFHPGEQLRLVVSGRNTLGPMMPMVRDYEPRNSGQHVVHTGGSRPSYLQLPVQPR